MAEPSPQPPHSSRLPQVSSWPRMRNCHRSTHPVHKTLTTAANLANLLPTGTVLAFRALTPSFTNRGTNPLPSNRYLISLLIGVSALICFLSSFTDSFIDPLDGKLYYGIATFRGLYVFDYGIHRHCCQEEVAAVTTAEQDEDEDEEGLKRFKISGIDFVHAFLSLIVFLVFDYGIHRH